MVRHLKIVSVLLQASYGVIKSIIFHFKKLTYRSKLFDSIQLDMSERKSSGSTTVNRVRPSNKECAYK